MEAPILSVCLITYNQAGYIRKAIDSILMQKVNVTWEIIIADDHSSDGTREIIKEYLEKYKHLIRVILQDTNVGAVKNWTDLMRASQAKYIAYLEGDDYWTDPLKLNMEIVFLEANPDHALICTDYDVLKSASGEVTKNYLGSAHGLRKEFDIILKNYIFHRYSIRSLTVALRRSVLEAYFNETDQRIIYNPAAGDLPLWLYILGRYKVHYLPVSTATYRIIPGTGSRPGDPDEKRNFQINVSDILEYFIRKSNLSSSYLKKLKTQRTLTEMEYNAAFHRRSVVVRQFVSLLRHGVLSRRAINFVRESFLTGK